MTEMSSTFVSRRDTIKRSKCTAEGLMKILDTVNRDLTEAIRKQDRERLKPLRMLKAALVNKRVEAGHALTEFESQQVVASMVKQRKDSI